MSYSDYLIKVGSDGTLPNTYIKRGSYKAVCEKIISGQYADGLGVEHFEVLPYRKLKVEISISDCPEEIYEELLTTIRSNFINLNKENILVTAFVPKLGKHVTQECIFNDESPNVYAIVGSRLVYQSIKFVFNGIGGAVDLTVPESEET